MGMRSATFVSLKKEILDQIHNKKIIELLDRAEDICTDKDGNKGYFIYGSWNLEELYEFLQHFDKNSYKIITTHEKGDIGEWDCPWILPFNTEIKFSND